MNTTEVTNAARVCGEITKAPVFSHEILGEKFFGLTVSCYRLSGIADNIPVQVSERTVDIESLEIGRAVQVTGTFRSYNRHNENGRKNLMLYVFADEISDISDADERLNEVTIEGYICREPIYRVTALGRTICDVLMAVNRAYGKSDYIPCIAWGRNANFVGSLDVGTRLRCEGRIQSRTYLKNDEEKTAYEVSLSSVRLLD